MRPRGTGQDGFTLIEALVAFAIVAAAILVVQRGVVQARHGISLVSARAAPEAITLSLLAEPLADADLKAGGRTGLSGGRRYALRFSPLVDLGAALDLDEPQQKDSLPRGRGSVSWVPIRVSIAVETEGRDWLRVETVKLGRAVRQALSPGNK